MRRQCLAGLPLLLAAAAVALSAAAGPRFYGDDPLAREPESQDASRAEPVDVGLLYDLSYNLFVTPAKKPSNIPAGNINTIDELPDSGWFTNRVLPRTASVADFVRGPNTGAPPNPERWVITREKSGGFAPGFTARDANGETWFVSFDPRGYPDSVTGGVVVANKIFWALGYYQVENHLITVRPDRLGISDKAAFRPPSGIRRPLRRGDLDDVFRRSHRNADGSYRAVAGRAIPGKVLGGFRYFGTRPDDPNDVVPHEHRRELRALRVFGAWTNLVDMKAGNTLDTLIEVDGRGVVRHYLQDVGSTFGSSAIGARDPDESYDYLYQGGPMLKRALLLGFPLPVWATVPYPDAEVIGRFEGKVFDPTRWKPRAPTAAFLRARPDDDFWAARRVAAFPDAMIYAIARTGEFSDPLAAAALAKVLVERRDKIARAYLPAVNPIVDVALSPDGALTFVNAAVDAKVAPAPASYAIEWARFDNATGGSTPIGQRTLVTAPRATAPAGLPTEPGAYVKAQISAVGGPPAWATPVSAYLRRTGNTWTLVGLERQP